jgi:NAD+ kinase
MTVEAVGIIAHTGREPSLACARTVCHLLREHGKRVYLAEDLAEALGVPELAVDAGRLGSGQLLVALGGDGTLLAANRLAAGHETPVLGVHVGGPASFGFLTETTPAHVEDALRAVLLGDYEIETRLMIRGDVHRGNQCVQQVHGLNDLVIRAQARMLKMRVTVEDVYIATYAADGIIVATPTGSTAYSLAAGGPLVHPAVESILLTPICPHTLNVRSLLVAVEHAIEVRLEGPDDQTLLTVDGQESVALEPGDQVTFRRSELSGRFISLDGAGFYQRVHTRLRLGERFGS